MTADDEAFLAAIRADLDNDVPRLVYADWLEEQGNTARAEFIRVECESASTDEAAPRYRDLEDRRHDLLAAHEAEWLGDLADYDEWFFRRGFVDEVRTSIPSVVSESRYRHPIRSVGFGLQDGLGPEAVVDELQCLLPSHRDFPWPTPITELDLSRLPSYTPSEWSEWFHHWPGEQERKLHLADCGEGDELAATLQGTTTAKLLQTLDVGTPHGPRTGRRFDVRALMLALAEGRLNILVLSNLGLNDDDLEDLLRMAPQSLRSLDLSYNSIAPFAFRAFNVSDSSLESLNLSATPLGVFRLREVLRSVACRTLKTLKLDHTGSARPNLEALLDAPFWSQAESLHLRNSTVPTVALEAIAENAGPANLRKLDLGQNFVRSAGVKLLADAPWTKSLTWLALDENYLDDAAAAHLAEGFPQLRTLHLQGNNFDQVEANDEALTPGGAAILAQAEGLKNLRLLNVGRTHLDDRAVELLLHARHWSLSGLGLSGLDLTPRVVEMLAGSPQLARLDWLDLSDCRRLSGDALRPLAESPYLSPLCELNIHRTNAGEAVRAALRERLGRRLS